MSRPEHIDRPKMSEIRYRGAIDTVIPEKYDSVELKMDGMYGFMDISKGQWTIKSRTGNIVADGVWPRDSDDFVLIGEWMARSHWAKRMGDIEENSFYPFDILYSKMRGRDETRDLRDKDLYTRRRYLRQAIRMLEDSRYDFDEGSRAKLPLIIPVHVSDKSEWKELWEDFIISYGYEGLVFKSSYSKFDDKNAWARMKKEIEMDYICVGFEPANDSSKYKGQVGAVKGTLIDKDVIVECGGLTDAQRQDYTDNAEKYKGRIFTAKGNDWYPSGSIRHPKFREWRDDKTHYECSYTQVPEDIRDGVSES